MVSTARAVGPPKSNLGVNDPAKASAAPLPSDGSDQLARPYRSAEVAQKSQGQTVA